MARLYLYCALCGRRQADGLLSGAAWRRLGLGVGGEPVACPECAEATPDWRERLVPAGAVAAVKAGLPVLMPTDAGYSVVADPYHREASERLVELVGRDGADSPTLVTSDVDLLFECLPELHGRAGTIVRALLPGAYMLVVPNPARRYRWAEGGVDSIAVRVPALDGRAAEVLAGAGAVLAVSASGTGGDEPVRLGDVPEAIRSGVAVVVDGGEVAAGPPTALDLTGPEPRVLYEGAAPASEALATAAQAV
jgi:L-threonylcarbamoyladenylate synthase